MPAKPSRAAPALVTLTRSHTLVDEAKWAFGMTVWPMTPRLPNLLWCLKYAALRGECPERQRELTVNQPSNDFAGSSPASPTNKDQGSGIRCRI
jgi:hypothetical protein